MTDAVHSSTVCPEVDGLRLRLEEAEETLRAIRSGEVDGVVISEASGDHLYSLGGDEHPYRLFFEAMNEGTLMLGQDGLILFCNLPFARLLNMPVEAVAGQNIDTIPDLALKSCLVALLKSPGARCDPVELDLTVDGGVRTMKFDGKRLSRDGWMAVLVTDVSEGRQRVVTLANKMREVRESRLAALNMMEDAVSAAHALERVNRELEVQVGDTKRSDDAHRRLAAVVEQAVEIIIVTELDGTIVYVNPAFERTTGYTPAEVIGRNASILNSGKQTREFYQQLWGTIKEGGVWHGHFVNRRKDGTLYEEDATISPVRDASGAIINYVAIKRDVTAEIALTEQLRHAQKIEAIGTLAGGVAHDFNNLLQAMLSIVQVLKRKTVDPGRVPGHLDQLEKAIRRGSGLTRQLLLFARREISRREELDLNKVLGDIRAFLRRVVRANIRLIVEPAAAPVLISADHGQIEQVITNLAVNAIDAMPEGGALSIAAGRDERTAWLTVSDTGTGIPEEIRGRIFEPFFTTKDVGKGTGLGLSVVYGIIETHGGRIDVECPPAGGTTFRIELPLNVAVERAKVPSAEEELPVGHGERLLVVEDDEAAREGVMGTLEILGYSAVAVGSGEEALVIEGQPPFSAVLTDSMLPGIPGTEVIRRLRERWPRIKAILMSGYAAPGVIDAGVAANEFFFLQKPFDIAVLARTLRAVLGTSIGAQGIRSEQ